MCQYLLMFVSEDQQDWDTLMALLLLAYRSSIHESTGYTPLTIISGQEMNLPQYLLLGRPPMAEVVKRIPHGYRLPIT